MTRDNLPPDSPQEAADDVGYGCAVWWTIVIIIILLIIAWWAFVPWMGGGYFVHKPAPNNASIPTNVQTAPQSGPGETGSGNIGGLTHPPAATEPASQPTTQTTAP